MRILAVEALCGRHCLSPDEGEVLYKELYETLRKGEDVLLDFSEVETTASSFLNFAVGRLYGKFDHGFVDSRVRWSGLDQQDDRVLRLVIDNAKEHFRRGEAERKAAARIAHKVIGE
jgi:hypothetical protein